ncbi:MAG: AAA family ATPase [Candidatus Shapirobacteria bacterium]
MKISFNYVEIKNFLAFGDVPQKIVFTEGLNLITGANGVGKTSQIDAISFALFGKTPREEKQEDLINYKNRKDCVVTLSFSKGDNTYTISRGLKPNFLKIIENEKDITESLDKRDSQATLEDILGINYSIFTNLIYTNVNDFVPLLRMTKPQKRAFIERLFDIQIFTRLQEKSKDKIKAADNKSYELSNTKKTNLTLISEYRTIIEDLKKEEDKISVKDEIKNLEKENLNAKKFLKEFKIEINKDNLKENKIQLTSVLDNKIRASESLSTATSLLTEFKTQKSNLEKESEESVKEEVESLELQITRMKKDLKKIYVTDIEDKLIGKENELENYTKPYKVIQEEITELEYDIKSDYKEIEKIENKIKLLEETHECPTCDQKVDQKYIAKKFGKEIDSLNKKINKASNKVTGLKEDRSNMEELRDRLAIEIEIINKKIKDTNELKAKIDNKVIELASLTRILDKEEENKKARKKKIKELTELIEQKENVIIDYNARISEYETKVEDLETNIKYDKDQIKEYEDVAENLDKNNRELSSLNRILEQEKKSKQDAENKIKEYGTKIKNLGTENETIIKEINKLNTLLDYLNCIKDVCKDEKIKQHVISSSLPMINKYTNDYLEKVGFRFYLEINKFIDAEVKGPGIFGNSIANLSGGESKSVDLALSLALHDIMRVKAANHFDVLFMDEVLDSSVDGNNIGRLVEIIKAKQEKDKLKVYIISHRPEIQDIEFNSTLRVTKERGYSKIEVS